MPGAKMPLVKETIKVPLQTRMEVKSLVFLSDQSLIFDGLPGFYDGHWTHLVEVPQFMGCS